MPPKSLITRQSINPAKAALAAQMRREMTPAEGLLWSRLHASRLEGFHFRRQQVIEPYIVDFYCHLAKVVVEVDDGIHNDRQDYDHQREQFLVHQGLAVLRCTNLEVQNNLDGVLGEILRLCRERTETK